MYTQKHACPERYDKKIVYWLYKTQHQSTQYLCNLMWYLMELVKHVGEQVIWLYRQGLSIGVADQKRENVCTGS